MNHLVRELATRSSPIIVCCEAATRVQVRSGSPQLSIKIVERPKGGGFALCVGNRIFGIEFCPWCGRKLKTID